MRNPAAWDISLPICTRCGVPQQGFSLIELVTVLAIAGLLASMAAPSFSQLAASLQLTSASNALVSSLYLARSEAIKRNGRVVLCKTSDGMVCANNGSWDQGWIVFHDVNNNGLRETTETVIHRQLALGASVRVTGNATVDSYISFVSTGGTKLVGGGFQAGTLILCRASSAAGDSRQIILNAAGRPRVQKTWVSSCD
jgi:type IV fimbrial biogenesis protein FimT